ncbi:MAG: hypothetical protein NC548_22910 [Lachnospiraceae bacterium]|nr:hypothetical protein [Lachnospiraceae bacterium]
MNLLIFFILLNVTNVILQTIKSLLTNKGNKWTAAIGNAVAYGLYTVLLVYMTCDLTLWAKVLVVGACNLVGVFIVKYAEEKMQKDKLWKVELTIAKKDQSPLYFELKDQGISFNTMVVDKWALFNCYCPTKRESHIVRETAKKYNAKFFANEAKIL